MRDVRVPGAYLLLGADGRPGVIWHVGAYVAIRLLSIEAETVEEPTLCGHSPCHRRERKDLKQAAATVFHNQIVDDVVVLLFLSVGIYERLFTLVYFCVRQIVSILYLHDKIVEL